MAIEKVFSMLPAAPSNSAILLISLLILVEYRKIKSRWHLDIPSVHPGKLIPSSVVEHLLFHFLFDRGICH